MLNVETPSNESVKNIEMLLDEVDVAMQRLADGQYQRCAECGAPIARERLLANPLESTCEQHPRLLGDAG